MKKQKLFKRIVAGLLAVLTTATTIPLNMTVLADDVNAVDTEADANVKNMLKLIEMMDEVQGSVGMPSFMVSEGDTVQINGETVATTTVPITKALINDQEKIRSQYWLNTNKYGNYAELKQAYDKLQTYFNNTYKSNIEDCRKAVIDSLIAVRDLCIAQNVTGTGLYSISDANTVMGKIEKYAGINGNVAVTSNDTIVKENNTEEGENADTVDVNAALLWNDVYVNAEFATLRPVDAVGYNTVMQYINDVFNTLLAEYATMREGVEKLIGDPTVDSQTNITTNLQNMSLEELAYAYANLLPQLQHAYELLNCLTDYEFDLYQGTAYWKTSTLYDFLVEMSNYTYVNEDGSNNTSVQDYINAIDDLKSNMYCVNSTALQQYATLMGTSYTYTFDNNTVNFGDINKIVNYVASTDYTQVLTVERSNKLQELNDLEVQVITGIPIDCKQAWYMLYDTTKGYDAAVNSKIDISTFEKYFKLKQTTLNGAWDYNATQYDVIKYVTKEKEVNGTTVEQKEAILDSEQNPKHYARQNEVTPWMNLEYIQSADVEDLSNAEIAEYDAYTQLVYSEMFRNVTNVTDEWYNPKHKSVYKLSDTPDMQVMLQENGYEADGTEEFKCIGYVYTVDRYALDDEGADAKAILHGAVDITATPDLFNNISVQGFLDLVKAQEFSIVTEEDENQFKDCLATFNITDEETVAAYLYAYKTYMSNYNSHNGYAITIDYYYASDGITEKNTAVKGDTNNTKMLLAEIPEYSISEYYEDRTDLLKVDEIKSVKFLNDAEYASALNSLIQNPDKIYNVDSDLFTFSTVTKGNSWEKIVSSVNNRVLGFKGSKVSVPVGVRIEVPGYVPVSGRTFDTRYYVKYIPYSSNTLPDATNSAFYAVNMTDVVDKTISAFVSVTNKGAAGFTTLPVNADKAGYMTVFYAQDIGVDRVYDAQRMMLPIVQYTVSGSGSNNLNNSLSVNGEKGTANGYQKGSLGVGVAETGLPKLVWNEISGQIVNGITGENTYSGDVHLWVSKESGADGLLIADWVNDVPSVLKDSIGSTQTKTGVYDEDIQKVSVEKPTRISKGDVVVIESGITSGTYADWLFKRKLVQNEMVYCSKCGRLVSDLSNHKEIRSSYTYTYRVNGKTGDYIHIGTTTIGGTSITAPADVQNLKGSTVKQGSTKDYHMKDVKNETPVMEVNGKKKTYVAVVNSLSTQRIKSTVSTGTNSMQIIATTQAEAKKALMNQIRWGNVTPGDKIEMTYKGEKTVLNPNGRKEVWRLTMVVTPEMIKDPPNPNPPTPPQPQYKTVTVPVSSKLCEGPFEDIAVWTLQTGNSSYSGASGNYYEARSKGSTMYFKDDLNKVVFGDLIRASSYVNQYRDCYDEVYKAAYPIDLRDEYAKVYLEYASKYTSSEVTAMSETEYAAYKLAYRKSLYAMLKNVVSAYERYYTENKDLWVYKQNCVSKVVSGNIGNAEKQLQGSTYYIDKLMEVVEAPYDEQYARSHSRGQDGLAKNVTMRFSSLPDLDAGSFSNNNEPSSYYVKPPADAKYWGTSSMGANMAGICGVKTSVNLEQLHNDASEIEVVYTKDVVHAITQVLGNKKQSVQSASEWVSYVLSLFNTVNTNTEESVSNISAKPSKTLSETSEEQANSFVQVGYDLNTGAVNAMIVKSVGNSSANESFAAMDEDSSKEGVQSNGTVEVVTPKITYVPYTIINNISGVTKSGTALEYNIDGYVNRPTEDVFGVAIKDNEYVTEEYKSVFKANIVPEVLMTYKDSFLNADGSLKVKEDRGALNSIYVAGYNEYAMDLPMYNKVTLTYDIDGDDIKSVGAATAKNSSAKTLENTYDVLYTGTEVSTVIESASKPQIEFKSYVIDFADANIGRSWNVDYSSTLAQAQAQAWLNSYKGANAGDADSFEYTATLSTTYSKSRQYEASSNADNSSKTSTLTVEGNRVMQPIEVAQDYSFDIGNNQYSQGNSYPIIIRNGRIASIEVDGEEYVMYANGATSTELLMQTAGYKKLVVEHKEIAEVIAKMQLAEFASRLTHNGGSQTWKSYEGTSIYEDNRGKCVVEEVGEEKGIYDPNYSNASGWYGEDVTVLELKEYSLSGEIENEYAYSYKLPIDYGYSSPKSKKDLFKSGSSIYAYNEFSIEFKNTDALSDGSGVSGAYDIVGDERTGVLKKNPSIGYVISNATVNDMTR
jgi:hypothetical protein